VTKYIRYRTASGIATSEDAKANSASYGMLDGETVREISGGLFGERTPTGSIYSLSQVKLLYPCQPTKILCVGLNYKSHLSGRPQPTRPEIFYKPLSALQDPGGPIVTPRDATDLHYEGELVAVIGKQARNVSAEEAREAIFGVTCGNDVSERNWQHGAGKDLQWWRAKGSDTFAPFGPVIAAGADYGNLQLTTRLNGEVVQQQYTSDLIFDCAAIVSWISGWVTLYPGDVIYTGTPGSTRKMSPGDVVQVELEGVGVLENPVA
jgi:2-keto-4-pentenoate hydratase/2-oxohepta-3-ene-1,7-dioic acid hydratase in catechol pathway